MRKIFQILAVALLAGGGGVANGQTTNASPPAPNAAVLVSNCLVRLDALVEMVEALHQASSNDSGRADCIDEKLNSIKSLVDLAHSYVAHLEMDDVDTAGGDQAMVESACSRGERLAAEAAACRTDSKTKNKKRGLPAALVATNTDHAAADVSTTPASAIRDAATCLKQAKLAALLAQSMGLEITGPLDAPGRELAKLGIAPLGGWSGEDCATVDDLCVVVARTLNLKVAAPDDPYSYVKAVRNEGLPVDTLLPRRLPDAEPSVLLEAEVRAFLARGYAARLPSSQRLQPD